mmetsp:Transcript_28375/g.62380  ORF Transcript_28375/g.62380 Transcript_28375/m.62380 type:complete len:401 (+) Transcript_28375:162-1364(+)|eukprot:CAMPEP_0202906126 /NCGR_PEP_ID=MMETSP1392-20130828/37449_1 /ASSEMBLY_ACC=CAM_ASM_000868 /TAXON_ID=225041 /ORGANISM="Chlamydomonas chlamydogama, Strain SAG 11-48b" /LENGTH=400 /DNA_ID=CAMNT_0049594493 /DNA_START=123 /DNA_END=1325 /DNA_ORIENTATION=-
MKNDPDPAPQPARRTNVLVDAAAALLTSSAYTTAVYPIHRVKAIIQTQDANPEVQTGKVSRYTFWNSFPRLAREQGLLSLWRGNMPYMLRHVPSTTLSFTLNAAFQHQLPEFNPRESPAAHLAMNLLAGGMAGAISLAIVYPLDFATIKMAANLHERDPGMMDTLRNTQRQGGLMSLYRGFGVSVLAIGAYKALYFGLWDTAKDYLEAHPHQYNNSSSSSSSTSAVRKQYSGSQYSTSQAPGSRGSGTPSVSSSTAAADSSTTNIRASGADGGRAPAAAAAAAPPAVSRVGIVLLKWAVASGVVWLASTITYPLDVMRKRLVVDTSLPPPRRQFLGFWDCVRKTARREGLAGFYRFYLMDMVLRFGGGILLVAYDEAQHMGHHTMQQGYKAAQKSAPTQI